MRTYTFIDLFAGAGGMALGFEQAGFRSVYAVEIDRAAAETYRRNFKHDVYVGPIETLEKIPFSADIIIGGPPCQGFSPLGKMSPTEAHARMNQLWRHYVRIVKDVRPLAFVIENVPELLKSCEYPRFIREVATLGYATEAGILNAAEFGVPQRRRRAFIVGVRNDVGLPQLPEPVGEVMTVRDAIADLPRIPTGENWHIGRLPTRKSMARYRCVPPGGNRFDLMKRRPDLAPACWLNKPTGSTDVFGRLEWDKPALTIRTEFFKPEKGRYLHPEAHRPITHREAARLQSFPDDFIFHGSRIEVAKQIGNAVPSKLARAIAVTLRSILDTRTTSPCAH